jgi:hypothetical protein
VERLGCSPVSGWSGGGRKCEAPKLGARLQKLDADKPSAQVHGPKIDDVGLLGFTGSLVAHRQPLALFDGGLESD